MKYYSGVDLVNGQAINSPDPTNPQDAATKGYVDRSTPLWAYWEQPTVYTSSASNSYTGAWANGPALPPTTTITKLFASTRIRVKIFNIVARATGAGGNHFYGVSVGGGAIYVVTRFFHNRLNIRTGFPYGVTEFLPGSYAQVNRTGTMNVVFYVQTDSGVTWVVDTTDTYQGPRAIISELP